MPEKQKYKMQTANIQNKQIYNKKNNGNRFFLWTKILIKIKTKDK